MASVLGKLHHKNCLISTWFLKVTLDFFMTALPVCKDFLMPEK